MSVYFYGHDCVYVFDVMMCLKWWWWTTVVVRLCCSIAINLHAAIITLTLSAITASHHITSHRIALNHLAAIPEEQQQGRRRCGVPRQQRQHHALVLWHGAG